MKLPLTSRKLFLSALLILVATNLFILLHVYLNRSETPESKLRLTERELHIPYRLNKEDSGLSLTMALCSLGKNNTVNSYGNWQAPYWLDTRKLESLGLNATHLIKPRSKDIFLTPLVSKEVFVVLEYDGSAYQKALEISKETLKTLEDVFKTHPKNKIVKSNYENAKKAFKKRQESESRLYIVDAALDPYQLRAKYSDRSRYIITKALIKASYNYQRKELTGYISYLSIQTIHVPLKFRKTIDGLIDLKQQKNYLRSNYYYASNPYPPRFNVTLSYGKYYEPWIDAIELIQKGVK